MSEPAKNTCSLWFEIGWRSLHNTIQFLLLDSLLQGVTNNFEDWYLMFWIPFFFLWRGWVLQFCSAQIRKWRKQRLLAFYRVTLTGKQDQKTETVSLYRIVFPPPSLVCKQHPCFLYKIESQAVMHQPKGLYRITFIVLSRQQLVAHILFYKIVN